MPAGPWESFAVAVLLAVGDAAPTRQMHKDQRLESLVEKLEQIRSNVSVTDQGETPNLLNSQLLPAYLGSERSLTTLKENWEQYELECLKYYQETPPLLTEGKFCNRTFDNYTCWPDGLPGTYVNTSCPWYLPSVRSGHVYRYCTLEGTWLLEENSTTPWRNTSECEFGDKDPQKQPFSFLSVIYTTGYAVSFFALIIATGILLGFRHLRCTRNYIHVNLFSSFILRAVSVFIKDSVLTWMYITAVHEYQWDEMFSYQESLSCRLVFVMMHYCVMANYYWLLVEGMYLYTLLVLPVFSEQRIFRLYLCIGWGVPMLFVILWGTVKYLYEDEGLVQFQFLARLLTVMLFVGGCPFFFSLMALAVAVSFTSCAFTCVATEALNCWNKNYNMNYWLIIRLPILIAIGVNFLIFIRIICIIIAKLQANLMCKTDIKCRLAKSTLTLIPLLGTHEIIFAFITDEHAKGMGLLVAVLYCFINNEVQTEFQKSWERWRLEHLYVQRDSSMKPLKCPASSISSGGTLGSTVYAATCQATCP